MLKVRIYQRETSWYPLPSRSPGPEVQEIVQEEEKGIIGVVRPLFSLPG